MTEETPEEIVEELLVEPTEYTDEPADNQYVQDPEAVL